jgi:rhamnulokinase
MGTHYLACDLGAESGRLMLGTLADGRLTLQEIHRFANTPIRSAGSWHWNIAGLFEALKIGLRKAAALNHFIASISADSWGVDYILCDEGGDLMPPTFHYRDGRTARGVEAAIAKIAWETIFEETGIQFMPLNTLFQLAAESPERLGRAARLLTIGDAFNYWLCGVARIDQSNASTTQLYNPRAGQWSKTLLEALDLPGKLFPAIVACGTKLGTLRPELSRETGLPEIPVIASCSHDTAAAVAAVPASSEWATPAAANPRWAYLSSGTWSLMGVELDGPLITDACRALNFTNEIGFGGTVRLLKNISGLWLVQECRRAWAGRGGDIDYAALTRLAEEAPPFVSLINPMDARFLAPADMPAAIASFCRETGQPAPATPGATIRCALESLALLYRRTLDQLEGLLGCKFARLHVIGGGSRNALLNQFTANAVQIPVVAGPVEATAAGNVLVQAITLGQVPSLTAARQIVRTSMETVTVSPDDAAGWRQQHRRFEKFF